jgi:hypothetical protein
LVVRDVAKLSKLLCGTLLTEWKNFPALGEHRFRRPMRFLGSWRLDRRAEKDNALCRIEQGAFHGDRAGG